MPRPDFIPRREADFLSFAQNFAQHISTDPSAYGVSTSDAALLQSLADNFAAAQRLASEPSTRTRPAVSARDAARVLLARQIRSLARRIRADDSVSDAQRIELGLTPTTAPPPYSGPPRTRPLLCARALPGNRVRLRLSDSASPLQRGKPPGAVGAVLFFQIAPEEGSGESPLTYAGLATTGLHTLQFPPQAARREVLITARWFNQRGEEGPEAQPARTMGVI